MGFRAGIRAHGPDSKSDPKMRGAVIVLMGDAVGVDSTLLRVGFRSGTSSLKGCDNLQVPFRTCLGSPLLCISANLLPLVQREHPHWFNEVPLHPSGWNPL